MGRNTTSSRKFAIIGVPSSAGARRPGQEQAPSALRASGLVDSLEERGVDVFDRGDLPKIVFRPDPENPRKQNLGDVGRVARNVAAELGRARGKETCPVVLGGDCTISSSAERNNPFAFARFFCRVDSESRQRAPRGARCKSPLFPAEARSNAMAESKV